MAPPLLRDLSDAELEARDRPEAMWEQPLRALHRESTRVGRAVSVLLGIVLVWPRGRWLLVPAAPLLVLSFVRRRALRRAVDALGQERRELQDELGFRRWRAGSALWAPDHALAAWARRLVQEAGSGPHAFRERGAPQWIVALQGCALPDGRAVAIRISLGADGVGSVERDPGGPLPREPLPPGAADELLGILASFPAGWQSVAGEQRVEDGSPCRLVVVRRDPPAEVALLLDRAKLGAEASDPPTVLARCLSRLAE